MRKVIVLLLLVLAGCGGGESNGTLSLTSPSADLPVNSSVTVSAVVTTPKGIPVGENVSFTTNHPELVHIAASPVNATGTATALITPVASTASPTVVRVTARIGDLVSSVNLKLKPYVLSVTPPSDETFSVSAEFAGGIVNFIPSGMFAKFSTPSGDGVGNSDVVVKLITVMGAVNGTPVELYNEYLEESSFPPQTQTIETDASGQVPILFTVSVSAPPPDTQAVATFIWKVTATDPFGTPIVMYGTHQVTVETDAAE